MLSHFDGGLGMSGSKITIGASKVSVEMSMGVSGDAYIITNHANSFSLMDCIFEINIAETATNIALL